MKKTALLFSFIAIMNLCGCAPKLLHKSEAYKGFYQEHPVTILLMPPINKTTNVDAKEYFHSTLNMPISNAGYYVIPPFMSMEILKRESAYDSEMFLNVPLSKFGDMFGADLALFTIIHTWEKAALLGTITVEVEYLFKSIKTNDVIYHRKGQISVNANSNSGSSGFGVLLNMAAAAIQTAVTAHTIVGSICNNVTLQDLPAGKYSPLNGSDGAQLAGQEEFKASVKGGAKTIQKQTATLYSKYAK